MTKAEVPEGYFSGDWYTVVVRIGILLIDIEFLVVIVMFGVHLRKAKMPWSVVFLACSIQVLFMACQEYLVFEHSLGCPNISG